MVAQSRLTLYESLADVLQMKFREGKTKRKGHRTFNSHNKSLRFVSNQMIYKF
jgi:hypothetical protein